MSRYGKMQKPLLSTGSKLLIGNTLFVLLMFLTTFLALVDGSNFAYVNIARATLYLAVASLIIFNISDRKVLGFAIAIVSFAIIEVLISYYISDISLEQLLKFFALLSAVYLFPSVYIGKQARWITSIIGTGALLYLFMSSFGYYANFFWGSVSNWLPDLNPNSLAAMVFAIFAILDRSLASRGLIYWLIFLASLASIYNFESRVVLIALMVYMVLRFILRKKPKIERAVLYSAVIFSIVMPVAYVAYSEISTEGYEPTGTADKRLFSGRQDVWRQFFDATSADSLVVGMSESGVLENLDVKGLHNAFIAIYYHLGILALVFFYFILCYVALRHPDRRIIPYIVAIIIISSLESTFSDGDYIGILMCLPFFTFIKKADREEK